MGQYINATTITGVLMALYLAFTGKKIYQMMNPLDGIEITDGPTLDPLWQANQKFNLICFLSPSPRFSSFKLSDLRAKRTLVFQMNGLSYSNLTTSSPSAASALGSKGGIPAALSATPAAFSVDLVITNGSRQETFSTSSNNFSNSNRSDADTVVTADGTYSGLPVEIPSSKLWTAIHANKTSVYLHVALIRQYAHENAHHHQQHQQQRSSVQTQVIAEELQKVVKDKEKEEKEVEEEVSVTTKSMKMGDALFGVVGLIKHDRVPKHFHQRYLLSDFGLVDIAPEDAEKLGMDRDAVISYWKPEVAVQIVNDFTRYPTNYVPDAIARNVVHKKDLSPAARKLLADATPSTTTTAPGEREVHRGERQGESGLWTYAYYSPSVHVDEIGLTSDKYIPLNNSVHALPLKLSLGPMSMQRWLLMANMEESLKSQSSFGFSDKDIDDVRRLISETSVYLLGVTLLASLLHLLFEFLAFQSDISFWQENKSLAGLSTRALLFDLLSQIVVFLYLLESDTSLLVTVPLFCGIFIQAWKVRKATGATVSWNIKQSVFPQILFPRWQQRDAPKAADSASISSSSSDTSSTYDISSGGSSSSSSVSDQKLERDEGKRSSKNRQNKEREQQQRGKIEKEAVDMHTRTVSPIDAHQQSVTFKKDEREKEREKENEQEHKLDQLTRVTLEADRFATVYLSLLLVPVVLCFILRSLLLEKHLGWYSWLIGALTSCVYTFGFALMCPQLYINHQLKSVSHLPWKFLAYKFLNTFIDDLFAFVIKMPTMHRLSVFRDDFVFLVYIYQRWIYRVDASRPVEK